ncbi:MAG: hypothetical protein JSW08_01930 [archaeon]|nr:MAG: hypothetical protein JSW08_01930 [archaeon]
MKKIAILLVVMGLLLALTVVTGLTGAFLSEEDNSLNKKIFTWTKAVCDENNYCTDFEIRCEANEMVGMRAISDPVKFSENWIDPRSEESKNKWC